MRRQPTRGADHATTRRQERHQARPPVRARQGQPARPGPLGGQGRGDRGADRQQESRQRSRSSTDDISSGRRGGLRSGTNRTKGRTRDQLYNEAREMGIDGRSKMNKEQLRRAVDRKKS
jgi:hypothetical protein